jgi:hypothetical protein
VRRSFALPKTLTSLFSCSTALFRKNTRVGVGGRARVHGSHGECGRNRGAFAVRKSSESPRLARPAILLGGRQKPWSFRGKEAERKSHGKWSFRGKKTERKAPGIQAGRGPRRGALGRTGAFAVRKSSESPRLARRVRQKPWSFRGKKVERKAPGKGRFRGKKVGSPKERARDERLRCDRSDGGEWRKEPARAGQTPPACRKCCGDDS